MTPDVRNSGHPVTLLIGVASGVITGLALAGLTAAVWWLQRAGYEVVRGVPDTVPAAWLEMEAGR
jgi:hypothetical protein